MSLERYFAQKPYPPAKRGVVVLWGLLGSFPFGGMTWQVLQHVVGLRQLGFDVWYVEDSDKHPYHPRTFQRTSNYRENVAYVAHNMGLIGLANRWVYRSPGTQEVLGGLDEAGLRKLYRRADAVLNLCGAQEIRDSHRQAQCLVLIETDPGSTQVSVDENDQETIKQLEAYDYLFTYAANIGDDQCRLPSEGFDWQPTRPPVIVEWWECARPDGPLVFTTVGNWSNRGKDVRWRGETYHWRKDLEFAKVLRLPSRVLSGFELTLGGVPDGDAAMLRSHGWRLREASTVANPGRYRRYLRSSHAEFTVAKDLNVRLRTGWFSDRSACYLAAGRPVITQDTGFGFYLPTGKGLMPFSSEDDAAEAAEQVSSDYEAHARSAQEIANDYLAASLVLGEICDHIGLA